MSSQPLSAIEQRYLDAARSLARQYSNGDIDAITLRRELRQAIARGITSAVLLGTGAARNAEVDALIQARINNEWAEVERLIALLDDLSADSIRVRLEAFTDTFEDARDSAEQIAQDSPDLVPVVGAGIVALIGLGAARAAQQRQQSRISLPRIDASNVQTLFDRLRDDMDTLSGQLANGEISLDEWNARMRAQVGRVHRAYYRLGAGRALGTDDQQRIQQRINTQYEYLDRWRAELENGLPSEAAIRQRARLYINAGNASLQDGRGSAIGLPPLPAVPGDGTTVCLTNCKCAWRIVQLAGNGNYDCYWRLRPAEHCPTCEARALQWNPIRVRNGVLQEYPTASLFT